MVGHRPGRVEPRGNKRRPKVMALMTKRDANTTPNSGWPRERNSLCCKPQWHSCPVRFFLFFLPFSGFRGGLVESIEREPTHQERAIARRTSQRRRLEAEMLGTSQLLKLAVHRPAQMQNAIARQGSSPGPSGRSGSVLKGFHQVAIHQCCPQRLNGDLPIDCGRNTADAPWSVVTGSRPGQTH